MQIGIGMGMGFSHPLGSAGAAVEALAFPALGAAYDFDFTTDDYQVIPPHTGTQHSLNASIPIIYRQMLTQVPHLCEEADGSLVSRGSPTSPPIRRTSKGLHCFNGLDQRINSPRDLTNASWVASGVTVSKTAAGRDGKDNAASLVTFTEDGGTLTQTTSSGAADRRMRLDVKRVSGTDPLEFSVDGGVSWTSFMPNGAGWQGWDHAASEIVNAANHTAVLRSKAGNSFVLDFVSIWGGRESIPSKFPLSGRLTSKTLIGRDRVHHTITSTGGTTGEEGINLVRSLQSHGFWIELSYSSGASLIASIGGVESFLNTEAQTITVRDLVSQLGIVAPLPIDDGTGTVSNKVMYHIGGGTLRLAINGTLYSTPATVTAETTTHDLGTSGAGSTIEGFIKRLIWFDDTRVPSDEEMIRWTSA